MGQATAERTSAEDESSVDPGDLDTDTDVDHDDFELDGLIDEQSAPGATGQAELSLTDLRDGMKRGIVGLINLAAPSNGTELEISTTLRCPIEPPLFISGKGSIKVTRSTAGLVTVTLAGAFGPSLGDGMSLYGDLFATAALQGAGADPSRAVDMLSLALENHLRSYYDRSIWQAVYDNWLTLAVSPGLGVLTVVLETGSAAAIADAIWGKGHMEAAMAGMKDGEVAQIQRGAAVGGSFGIKGGGAGADVSGEGLAGVVDQERIEKRPGSDATTSRAPVFVIAGKGSAAFAGCGFELQAPMTKEAGAGGFLKMSAKATGLPADIGQMANWSSVIVSGMQAAREAISQAPEGADLADYASQLVALETLVAGGLSGFQDQLIKDLSMGGLKNKIGVEVGATFDFVARTLKIQFLYLNGSELSIPTDSKAGVGAKTVVGPEIVIAL